MTDDGSFQPVARPRVIGSRPDASLAVHRAGSGVMRGTYRIKATNGTQNVSLMLMPPAMEALLTALLADDELATIARRVLAVRSARPRRAPDSMPPS
jgi:hypothetical protein